MSMAANLWSGSSHCQPKKSASGLSRPNLLLYTYCCHMKASATAETMFGKYKIARNTFLPFTPLLSTTAKNSESPITATPPMSQIFSRFHSAL